jgi:hypothetical protein
MKLIMENWRQFINESNIHPNIMRMIDRLEDEDGGKVRINKYQVLVRDRQGKLLAQVSFDPTDGMYGKCLGASVVSSSEAEGSYGPLAYDIAIEASGGLVSDRTEVSSAARDVWDYYDNNRPDVVKKQMDNLENELTPEEKDNCEQLTADQDDASSSWKDSPLSKKYSKPHGKTPVIDELSKRGMIYQEPSPVKDFPADGMTPSKYDGDTHPGGIP